jgi:hypothetical protein
VSNTADIARGVITSGDTSNNTNSNTTSNAHEHPQIAEAEMDALAAGGVGANTHTKRVAAAMSVFHDQRPYVSTKQGMVRRQHEDGAGITGTADTRRAAREALDLHEWAKDLKPNPEAVAAMHANDFAADVNRQTMEGTLPTNASTADIVAAIIARRDAK